jgi:transcriptional regulator with XRE-family HTH domain
VSNSYSVPEAVATAIAAGENAVKATREFVGYTVEELAVACGLAADEIARIESGDDSDLARLSRVAHALGLPEDAVLPR